MTLQRLFLLALVIGLISLAWRKNHASPGRPVLSGAPAAAVIDPGH